jgi:subtilisin family serine protease
MAAKHARQRKGQGKPTLRRQPGNDYTSSQYTGRCIVVFPRIPTRDVMRCLRGCAGMRVATSSDFASRAVAAPTEDSYAMYFERIGVAVVSAPQDQLDLLRSAVAAGSRMVPERYIFVADMRADEASYLEGFRDGVDAAVERMLASGPRASRSAAARGLGVASESATWNLTRVGASDSALAGRGVKLAVLDTGYDPSHPDFRDRVALSQSFVPGVDVQDSNGHGTHCLGTACGIAAPADSGLRYGCASEAEVMVGKVLVGIGNEPEERAINGINWAVEQGADIISISLEVLFDPASPFLPQYEAAGKRALDAGALIIAAAGNQSARPLLTRPVASPASAPSIMAVGAIDPADSVAEFSCMGSPDGEVDIAAPGVAIESASPMPRGRETRNGTSMAAPLVAGIAAMHKERDPSLQGKALWSSIIRSVDPLPAPPTDVGAGCVKAPA